MNRTLTRRPTIRDVAKSAGVGVGTVSHVLQGKDHLHTAETRERVLATVRELGYRPSRAARNLAQQRTDTLAVIIERFTTRLSQNSYYSHVLDGILEVAAERSYVVAIVPIASEDAAASSEGLDSGFVDGAILLAPQTNSPLFHWAMRTGIPAVSIGCIPGIEESSPLISGVDVDNSAAQALAARAILERGHTKIGYVCGPMEQQSGALRLKGFLETMSHSGLEFDPSRMEPGAFTLEGGAEACRRLMTRCPDLTALIAANDNSALGAMSALDRLGILVPQQVSVIGLDNINQSAVSRPTLSTVAQPMDLLGRRAAEILVDQIQFGIAAPQAELLSPELVMRESVRSLS